MSHVHPHLRPSSEAESRALRRSMLLTGTVLVAEIVGGFLAHSLALLSDAGHMVTDLLALALSAAAIRAASRPADGRRTFGYYRLEILAALANGTLLGFFALVILREAWHRFSGPPAVDLRILLPVALVGLLANILAFRWLRGAHGGLASRAALWHAAADGASSLLVVLAGIAMAFTRLWWIDPAASVVVALVIAWGAIRLLRDSVDVLLESAPAGLDVRVVEHALQGLDGVEAVHDVHVWCLTSEVHALAGHLRVAADRLTEADRILLEAQALLGDRFGIRHTTLQIESEGCDRVVCVLGPGAEALGSGRELPGERSGTSGGPPA